MLITSRLLDTRAVVIAGVLGSAAGLAAFAYAMTPTADLDAFVGVSLFFGFFFGMLNQPMGALVIGSMPLSLLAAGVSIYKLSSPIGLMLATGGMGAILDHRAAAFRLAISGDLALGRPAVARFVHAHHGDASGLAALVGAQAQTLAFASVMVLFGAILLVVIPIVCLAKIQRPGAPNV